MKIAPEIEQLMWLAAESGDPNAIADFERKFPNLRYELSKRIDIVRSLKQSRKLGKREGSIPRFMPRTNQTFAANRLRLSIAAVALCALAFGSYVVTKQLMASPTNQAPPVVHNVFPNTETVRPRPEPDKNALRTAPPNEEPIEEGHGLTTPEDETPVVAKWQQPQTVKLQHAKLADALRAIGIQCGLNIVVPPDMPDLDIVVNYREMTGFEMLADMGPRFGFTAFDQGNGNVIVVPARADEGGAAVDSRPHPPKRPEGNGPSQPSER